MQRFRMAVAALVLAGCARTGTPAVSSGPALFYAKGGQLYVSDSPGRPGRRLTTGPADTQPAPSPDGSRVAYVHRVRDDEPGGELRVLDVVSGESRRLVNAADIVPNDGDQTGSVEMPRWSPTGERIAFLKATYAGGGFLLTADAHTGAVTAPRQPLFADENYAWSPDGRQIVWIGGRSDVSPVDINVLTVGESSAVVLPGTNATSVGFDVDRRSVVFSNSDATGKPFAAIPFKFRPGGIYSYRPVAVPAPLFAGPGAYGDVAVLPSGRTGFTEWSGDQKIKYVETVGADGVPHRVAEATAAAQGPLWSRDAVAYIGMGEDRPLLIKQGEMDARQIDTGVDSFSWAGQTGG